MTEDAQPAAAPMEQQQGVEQAAASEVRALTAALCEPAPPQVATQQ